MNQELVAIFYEIADILDMKKVQWKPEAYRKAARVLENLGKDVREIYEEKGEKGLDEIPGVGEAITGMIIDYLKTGKVKKLEKLRKSLPKGVTSLMKVPGIGARKAIKLHDELGIKSVEELKKAAKAHKISKLESFKEKSEENILEGIKFIKKAGEKNLLAQGLIISRDIEKRLKSLKEVRKVITAGSVRRRAETVRDIDILVSSSNNKKVVDFFTSLPIVKRVSARGQTKAVIVTKDNMQVDIRIVKPESFGSALQYFTGSKAHNIHLRRIAIKKGLKLNEYGLFRGKKQVAGKDEAGIYKKLGMQYIEPELREEKGEIEIALKKKLPKLIEYRDLKGDLHLHTKWSDGAASVEEMARAARKLGWKYLAITDHGNSRPLINHVNEKKIEKQIKAIDKLNKKAGIKILKGIEVEIRADGTLALSNNLLKKLDIVLAGVHSGFKFPKQKQTNRVLKAMDNPYLNILTHPLNRLISKRKPVNLDLLKVYDKAKEKGIALEINASPDRLDLPDVNVKEAVEKGVKLAIGTDSHSTWHFKIIEFGVAIARRGWCKKKDVINTMDLKDLKKFLRW
jgi:DNA polymerase (family 10)